MGYDENSSDAMFARILAKLEEQDRNQQSHFKEVQDKLTSIETQTKLTNGRVNKLESWKSVINAKIAWVSGTVSVGASLCYMVIQWLMK